MNEEHENYRPKSPDLSALPPPPPPRLSRIPSYPDSLPPGYSFSPRGSYDASPFFSPQTSTPTSYFGPRLQSSSTTTPQQQSPPPPSRASIPHPQASPPSTIHPPNQGQSYYQPRPPTYSQSPYQPNFQPSYTKQEPIEFHHPQQSPSYPQQNLKYSPPHPNPDYHHHPEPANNYHRQALNPPPTYGDMPRTRQKRATEESDSDFNPNGPPPRQQAMMPVKTEQFAPSLPIPPSDPSHGIDVRTKFPVARIKRLMQADEDIGKVAQATPTAVSKALELFMIALVSKGAEEAKANNSKRITAQHLKAGLMKDGQYDFLTEICENVPEEGSKKGRAKSEPRTDTEDEVAPKKKAKAARKRKADTSDDSD